MEATLNKPILRAPRKPVVPSAVLGTLAFVFTEVMFFSGLMSAFTISRASALPGTWPVPGQPRLPAESTLLNTAMLILSGLLLVATQVLHRRRLVAAKWTMLASWLLGAAFVVLQGTEWAALLRAGFTVTSSALGSFFYVIVGGHALHAVAALVAFGWAWVRLARGNLPPGLFFGVQTFWYFVVGMWPVIYVRVYF